MCYTTLTTYMFQIDKTYFSREMVSGQPQNAVPKNSKGSRKTPLLPSLPSDLATPKELKASTQQQLQPARPIVAQNATAPDTSSSSRSEPSRGTKRPSDAMSPPIPAGLEPPHKRQALEAPPLNSNSLAHSEQSKPTIASSSSHTEPTITNKRPLDKDETRGPNPNPPKPIPRKKPKQPQTMFIPKKRT